MPVTTAGLSTAGAGFVGGWAAIGGLLSLIFAPFRRRARY
jgi:hypothetical protein